MRSHSAKALVASRRNLALGGASYCKHCSMLVPDEFQESHFKEMHPQILEQKRSYHSDCRNNR